MTTLRVDQLQLPGADLGPENPLPALGTLGDIQNIPVGPGVPESLSRNIGYGMRKNPLPYALQDGYDRNKSEKTLKTIVLENDFLKATFLPEYGGRMWSLYDKVAERDLVTDNPVFQPANLAIRNAWLSGGVEWNIGLRGHSPFTCSHVFAASVQAPDGTPILRIYEYERIRQVPYQVDFFLPAESRQLFVFVRIINPHDQDVPMYWWSNIAYPEHPGTRVVAPAEQAFRFGYGSKGLSLGDIPVSEGVDVTYSVNLGHSADFFFNIPPSDRKWIAALDADGTGLFQASTDRLIGRKLFVWGTGSGGNAWQEFLSVRGKPYLEIQAGLAHTQMEHVPMPGKTEWSWIEAYGLVTADPETVHGESWPAAYSEVGSQIESRIPRSRLEDLHEQAKTHATLPLTEVLHTGAGWGCLETLERTAAGAAPMTGGEIDFSCELAPAQQQWRDLLESNTFPEPDPTGEPTGFELQSKWRTRLQGYVAENPGNWYAQLHLGLMLFETGDHDGARACWEAAHGAVPNAWAVRNLAALASLQGDPEGAVEKYREAFGLLPTCRPIAVEYGKAALKADCAAEWVDIHESLPKDQQESGRFQLLYAQALLETGRLDEALAIVVAGPEVTDLREGENSLTDVWYRIHEKKVLASDAVPEGDLREYVEANYPPPAAIDFRMKTGVKK